MVIAQSTNGIEISVERGGETMWWDRLPFLPEDEVFHTNELYIASQHPDKVNLGIGVYRTDTGKPWLLPSVVAAEEHIREKNDISRHEYLPPQGDVEYLKLARDLVLGTTVKESKVESRTASVQTISGTGAVHIGAAFMFAFMKPSTVWLSDPTWSNHHRIVDSVGLRCQTYPYLHSDGQSVDVQAMCDFLQKNAAPGDTLLLQPCAHNPTGQDPTQEQWKQIAELCKNKQLIVFFDCAYQGFASGDPKDDTWAIQYFVCHLREGTIYIAQSFSKNLGVYGHRVGALHIVRPTTAPIATSHMVHHLTRITRGEYSLAPKYGSTLVKTVLGDTQIRNQWMSDLKEMSGRIKAMRLALYNRLLDLKTPGKWEHIIRQVSRKPERFVRHADASKEGHVFLYRAFQGPGQSIARTLSYLHLEYRPSFYFWVYVISRLHILDTDVKQ